jgi:hypothetical protein
MTDVLIFIEDPGAANFIVPMIPAIEKHGLSLALRATGTATSYIRQISAVCPLEPEGNAKAILDSVMPRLVLTGTSENPQTLGLSLVADGRNRSLPTVAAVDAASNAASRFKGLSSAPFSFAPDHLLVPDRYTADAYVALGYPTAKLTVCGHPYYDIVFARSAALKEEGRDQVRRRIFKGRPTTPAIVFVAEVSTGLAPEQYLRSPDYLLQGSGRYVRRTEIVIEEFLDAIATIHPRPYTVLRLHPKNSKTELAPFLDLFDEVSEGGSGLETVFAADAVCGMTSMLLAEAAIANRPTLAILPRIVERDWIPSLIQGSTLVANTREALHASLRALACSQPDALSPRIQAGAAERAAAVIKELISSNVSA